MNRVYHHAFKHAPGTASPEWTATRDRKAQSRAAFYEGNATGMQSHDPDVTPTLCKNISTSPDHTAIPFARAPNECPS